MILQALNIGRYHIVPRLTFIVKTDNNSTDKATGSYENKKTMTEI